MALIVWYVDEWFVLCWLLHIGVIRISLQLNHIYISGLRLLLLVSLVSVWDSIVVWLGLKHDMWIDLFGSRRAFQTFVVMIWSVVELWLICCGTGLRLLEPVLFRLVFGIVVVSLMVAGGIVYLGQTQRRISFGTLCISLFVFDVLAWLWCAWNQKNNIARQLYQTILKQNGKEVSAWAYYDSGNGLFDPYFGKPVVLCSNKILLELGIELENRLLIPFYSLGESDGWIDGFVIDELCIKNGCKERWFSKIILGDASKMFEHAKVGYDLILHRSMGR